MNNIKNNYGIYISIFIILCFGLFLWNDVHKEKTFYKTFIVNEEVIKVTLETNYLKANKTFDFVKKNNNLTSIQNYLKANKISSYLINTSKNMISMGSHKVGLEDPFHQEQIYQMIALDDHALCMDFSDTSDNTIITVISKNYQESKRILEELKNKTIDEGKEYLQNKDVSVLWYQEENTQKVDSLKIFL